MRRVVGFHPVRELLRSRPESVARVLLSRRRDDPRRRELLELCRQLGVTVLEVPAADLGRDVEVHNGVAAEVVDGAVPRAPQGVAADPQLVVLLEDVQDPRNLGAILRVCEAAGVGRVLVRDRGSAPISPIVEKASAGATRWLTVERIVNSGQAFQELKDGGYWVYGAAQGGVVPWSIDLTGPICLCLGGEAQGLRARTRELCDGLVGLPMRGHVGSLNVATAAAALLYEAVRQRTAG